MWTRARFPPHARLISRVSYFVPVSMREICISALLLGVVVWFWVGDVVVW